MKAIIESIPFLVLSPSFVLFCLLCYVFIVIFVGVEFFSSYHVRQNSEVKVRGNRYILYLLAACCYILLEMGCVGSKKSVEELPKRKYEEQGEVRQEVSFQKAEPFELVVKKVEEAPQEEEKSNDSDKPKWQNREFLGLPEEGQQLAGSKINIIYSSDKQDLPNLAALTRLESSPIPASHPHVLPFSVISEKPGQQNASGINSSPPKKPIDKELTSEMIEVEIAPPPLTLREINEIVKENSQILSKQNPKSRLNSFMNLSSMSSENKKGERVNIEQQIDPFAFIAIPRIEICSLVGGI